MSNNAQILSIDIGGTFTDLVLYDLKEGHVRVGKVLTSYPDPAKAVLAGVSKLLANESIHADDIERVIHGTTLVTNALIERRGAKTALLTTRGFRDALEIGNEGRYDIYDLALVKPKPLVERRWRLEVSERIHASGQPIQKLNTTELEEVCLFLKKETVQSIAISFLHAFTNPVHELAAADIISRRLPEMSITLSHQVAPAIREYPRTSTAVANAYVRPLTQKYLQNLANGLKGQHIHAPLHIMLSNGGTCTTETAIEFPVRLVESGPAGGALAGAYWGNRLGYKDVLAFDMGGTTAKAVLSNKGNFDITHQSEVAPVHRFKKGSGLPLLVPMIHLIEIGAGGGSIAGINDLGLPKVGPQSAGSSPGPACYNLGGKEPTVTDADLLLGFLNPDSFAGGSIQLNKEAAQKAYHQLGQAFGLSALRLAMGIHDLVNENMAAAARVHAAERGLDIREHAMVATGGAGPVHACGVAEKLNLKTLIIPPLAGVGSAFGFLLAPISFDFTRTHIAPLYTLSLLTINTMLDKLEKEGHTIVLSAGIPQSDIQVLRSVDLRYQGQGYEIRVALKPGPVNRHTIEEARLSFEIAYRDFYGNLCEGVAIEAVNWRVVVNGPQLDVSGVKLIGNALPNSMDHHRRTAVFDPAVGAIQVAVYQRYQLPIGFQQPGPLIIEEDESTTVVRPGWNLRVDTSRCLVLERASQPGNRTL